MANLYRDQEKHPAPFRPADFQPDAEEQPQGMTREQWIAMARQWGAALGGAIK